MKQHPTWLPARLAWLWALDERSLLRAHIVAEAGGEVLAGKKAVADVAVNRVLLAREKRVRWWGTNIREVCLKPHQFSCFWADYEKLRETIAAAAHRDTVTGGARGLAVWQADRMAQDALLRLAGDPKASGDRSFGADHYWAPHAVPKPEWADEYALVCRVGRHDFHSSQFSRGEIHVDF